jgi:EAL domain-containing protein (putative c-di-GMP-specific phosphodiesterase class I)
MPESFIPLAEASGAVVPLGSWVLSEACEQLRRWRRHHPALGGLRVAVNLSPVELTQPDLVQRVAATLRAADLEPGRLTLEITETAIVADAQAVLRTVRALRGLGVHLALDDFGAGFSSLTYLRRFPVDAVKIDRSFVQELETSAGSVAIVRAVIALAHALQLSVVAEGFETPRQLARLRDALCDHGQGFFISEPLPPHQLQPLLLDALT